VKAEIMRKAFRGSEFLYTLRLKTGETVLAHVPSHHDHRVGEWIGIRALVDHVVTFNRSCAHHGTEMCHLPCTALAEGACARAAAAETEQPVVLHGALARNTT
jgi:iron(III) transport system ATP-binding protein